MHCLPSLCVMRAWIMSSLIIYGEEGKWLRSSVYVIFSFSCNFLFFRSKYSPWYIVTICEGPSFGRGSQGGVWRTLASGMWHCLAYLNLSSDRRNQLHRCSGYNEDRGKRTYLFVPDFTPSHRIMTGLVSHPHKTNVNINCTIFRRVCMYCRKAHVSFIMSARPSVCPRAPTWLTLDGFFVKFDFEHFYYNLSRKHKFGKYRKKKYRTLHVET
jgi:hypothetical protein